MNMRLTIVTGLALGVSSENFVFSSQPSDGFTYVRAGQDFTIPTAPVFFDMTFHDLGDVGVPEPSTWAASFLTAGALLCSFCRKRAGWFRRKTHAC